MALTSRQTPPSGAADSLRHHMLPPQQQQPISSPTSSVSSSNPNGNSHIPSHVKLSWTSHHPTVFSIFQNLLFSESMVDVTLAAEGKYLRAHKIILSACSPYFQELLSLDSSKHPILFMSSDTKFKDLRAILDYMYKGETDIHHEELADLLKLAESLQIRGLAETGSSGPSSSSSSSGHHIPVSQNSIPIPRHSNRDSIPIPPPASLSQPRTQVPEIPIPVALRLEDTLSSERMIRQQQQQPQMSSIGALPTQMHMLRSNSTDSDSYHSQTRNQNSLSNPYKRQRRGDTTQTSISSPPIPMPMQPPPILTTQSNSTIEEISSTPSVEDMIGHDPSMGAYQESGSSFQSHNIDGNEYSMHPPELIEVKVEGGLANEDIEIIEEPPSDIAPNQSRSVEQPFAIDTLEGEEEEPNWNPNMEQGQVEVGPSSLLVQRPPGPYPSTSATAVAQTSSRDSEARSLSKVENSTSGGGEHFVCPNGCGRQYLTQSSVQRHVRIECGQPATLICHVCRRVFKYKHRLMSHLRNIHKLT